MCLTHTGEVARSGSRSSKYHGISLARTTRSDLSALPDRDSSTRRPYFDAESAIVAKRWQLAVVIVLVTVVTGDELEPQRGQFS